MSQMNMLHAYIVCGAWRSFRNNEWRFIVDNEKRSRLLALESNTTFEELKMMVSEDYDIEQSMVDVEISYLPTDLIGKLETPPVIVSNDRQVRNLIGYLKKEAALQLCVTFKSNGADRKSKVKIDLNEEPQDSIDGEGSGDQNIFEDVDSLPKSSKGCADAAKWKDDIKRAPYEAEVSGEKDFRSGNIIDSQKINYRMVDEIKVQQHFKSKEDMKKTLEICAMKHNFDYRVVKSCTRLWCIRCKDNVCNWRIRAECLEGSTYFRINKYVAKHTCSPSRKSEFSRKPSAKTIGDLLKHKYEGVKDGPKPNDIINIMRTEHGSHISYSKAWDSREFSVNVVRGIPEKSFGKIPRYLHMLKEANPGTYTSYECDADGKFKYLFLSFGQSIRGFYKAIRRVVVVDGTFLKNKYKGILLVATAVDGNSNLYPIAFGIVDSENNRSWEWFFMQLKVVIADEKGLAFVSDRHHSIGKTIGKVYPLARHGICIHHLLNNVVKNCKRKGVASLVEKASKAYRIAEFDKLFTQICNISPMLGKYLVDADVKKWARCHFPGYRFDIRTKNPAESINSALRSAREYPLILLLDSITEMLTRWFYERKAVSAKQKDPLTKDVEEKIAKRTQKAKALMSLPSTINRSQVKGDAFEYVVDLERRTCSCRKFDLDKIPCKHAIQAAFCRNIEIHTLVDELYTTAAWRTVYEESINPIQVPEDEWRVPPTVEEDNVLPPHTRILPGRRKKRRHETVEDKIRSSQGSEGYKKHKCSRCGNDGHNRATCFIAI